MEPFPSLQAHALGPRRCNAPKSRPKIILPQPQDGLLTWKITTQFSKLASFSPILFSTHVVYKILPLPPR